MHPAWLGGGSLESAAGDSCFFALCRPGGATPEIANLFFLERFVNLKNFGFGLIRE
jgi:hypothetical protein